MEYQGKIGKNELLFQEVLITGSQKKVGELSKNFYLFRFFYKVSLNKEGQILISEDGIIERIRVIDNDFKKAYEITVGDEILCKVFDENNRILREIPAERGNFDFLIFPDIPTTWHFIFKKIDLNNSKRTRIRALIPLYDKDDNAGYIQNGVFAEGSDFKTVNLNIRIKTEKENYFLYTIAPLKIEVAVDSDYRILSFKRFDIALDLKQ